MTIESEDLSAELIVSTRDQIREKYLRDFRLRMPLADVREGTEPYNRASAIADTMVSVHYNARQIADATLFERSRGARLKKKAAELPLSPLPAAGATGQVKITASDGGTSIPVGRRGLYKPASLVFEVTVGGTYASGDAVPIKAVDTGPQTSLPIGAVIEWSNPPPGLGPIATVLESVNGQGLTGGRNAETDEEFSARCLRRLATPAASGNEAEYIEAIEDVESHGIPVSKGFVYPCWAGPGTCAVAFTVRPDQSNGTRIPTAAQNAAIQGSIEGRFPGDDHPVTIDIVSQPVAVQLRVTWLPKADGYVDLVPWPNYSNYMSVTAATTPLSFTVTGTGTPPAAGKTIGVFDKTAGVFRRKRIQSVSGAGPWVLTIDPSNSVSDTTFTPVVGSYLSPWSDSLDRVVPAVLAYFAKLGPGEMFASFVDDGGARQRRVPTAPDWPNEIDNIIVADIAAVSGVKDAILLGPTPPFPTDVGTPGALVYLMELSDLAVFFF